MRSQLAPWSTAASAKDMSEALHRSSAPANFSGAVFTHAHFQEIAQISSLCDFHYISFPSLMRFWLVMTNAADLAHADFWQT